MGDGLIWCDHLGSKLDGLRGMADVFEVFISDLSNN